MRFYIFFIKFADETTDIINLKGTTMTKTKQFITRLCIYAFACVVAIACKDTDDFFDKGTDSSVDNTANTFDFSTTQDIDLIVDYSAFNAKIPVYFSVYNVNPFVNENKADEYIDESIKPIFAAYTGLDGKYDQTVTLPAYARVLHIVTGNFVVGLRRTAVEIINGQAKAVVENPMANAQSRMTRGAWNVPGTGTATTDLSKMTHLYKKGNGDQVYKPWVTPLGTWDSNSGRPNYLLNSNDPVLISKGLVFTEEEFNGMYNTACDALNSGTTLKEQYRAAADLELTKAAEISITAMGSSTCWNSSLGYYYYDKNNPPQSKMDMNIIMLFPNTQDGQWPRGNYPNNKYNGNIGMLRGDVIQLKYYPNIANGDLSGESDIFPAGTKVGFILKTNAWGQRGNDYAVNGSSYAKAKNIWAATTDGLSSAFDSGVKFPNPDGEARSAKFAYTAPNGKEYVVVSFEDACDDKDYDDLMFALNPADAFDLTGTPRIASRRFSVEGVYGFEDKWPEEGDYDMNDLMVDLRHDMEYYTHPDGSKKLIRENFYLTPYHNYITLKNGLAVRLDNTISKVATIYVKKILPGQTTPVDATYKKYNNLYYYLPEITWSESEPKLWYLTDDITKQEGVTYLFEVTYKEAQEASGTTIKPFLWRKLDNGKHLEVHIPFEEPTSKIDATLFGKYADKSNPNKKKNGKKMYYVGAGDFPFAFYLHGVSIDEFKETILQRANESKRIDTFFPEFLDWSISEGARNFEWYLHKYVPNE